MGLTATSRRIGVYLFGAAVLLVGFLMWDGRQRGEIDRQELASALTSLMAAEERAAAYRAKNALMTARIDSLAKERARRDTVYVTRRAAAIPLLQPVDSITGDSALKLLPAVQAACTQALNACDAYKATAEAELAERRQKAADDSTRIGELTGDLTTANDKILDLLTAEPEPPTFKEKLQKVAKNALVVLAIIGAFFMGQAAP